MKDKHSVFLLTALFFVVAAVNGYHTNTDLYFGTKNKYFVVCARSTQQSNTPSHTNFKDWNGGSTSKEGADIVAGFLQSMEDRSVYSKILESKTHDNLAEQQIKFRNPLLYLNKLRDIVTTSFGNVTSYLDRKIQVTVRRLRCNILKCRAAVTKAMEYRNVEGGTISEGSANLVKDLTNGALRKQYFCVNLSYFSKDFKQGESDKDKSGLYSKIKEADEVITEPNYYYIYNRDSYLAEQLNSILASFITGIINYLQKVSQRARYGAAALSHNTGREYYSQQKTLHLSSPNAKVYNTKSIRTIKKENQKKLSKSKYKRAVTFRHAVPYLTKVRRHMRHINKTKQERDQLEKTTRHHEYSTHFLKEQRLRLTAKSFGLVCKIKGKVSCEPKVRTILYLEENNGATVYARMCRKRALKDTETKLGKKIQNSGLVIDSERPYLAATPDGLIDDDGILALKCPLDGEYYSPEVLLSGDKTYLGSMWKRTVNGSLIVRKNHSYYYQIQGQLHILKRNYCKFAIWTQHGVQIETIYRDDEFWATNMVRYLTKFYKVCLMPELIEPGRMKTTTISF